MNKMFTATLLISMLTIQNASASRVEYTLEDAYTQQAPEEINSVVDNAANLMNFTQYYEVIIPKKAGVQINPWNQFVAHTTNPMTKNHIALINPEFFATLSNAEQTFLAARVVAQAQEGTAPWSMKVIPWIWVLLTWLVAAMIFIFMTKQTRLAQYPWWGRAILVWAIVVICNMTFGMKLQTQWLKYVGMKHDTYINELVIAKTGNREAAINAMEKIDATIKTNIKNGESFFKPHEDLFARAAQALKKHEHKEHTGCCGGH